MSEEKLGQHYLAALNEAFPGVVLDHAWQTKDQLTVTVKVNYLPEVVEFLYYKQGGWLSVLFGNDERKLNAVVQILELTFDFGLLLFSLLNVGEDFLILGIHAKLLSFNRRVFRRRRNAAANRKS